METIRRSDERGFADYGWLKSFHTFSFGDYFDPTRVNFGALRVINEDRVEPDNGFGTHSHSNVEIISYVLSGELAHRDSLGNGSTLRPGDVQRISAGRGILHSEFNPSLSHHTHFLQIWIDSNVQGITPSYEERHFSDAEKKGGLRLIVSPDRAAGSLLIHQDARLYAGTFDGSERAAVTVQSHRRMYVHLVRGHVAANQIALAGGDALEIVDRDRLTLEGGVGAEVLVFDLPGG
jgi:redox-sensitive bicupin YhaK (pirin superfamily)